MNSAAEELSRGAKQAAQVRQLVSSGAGVQTQAAWLQRACVLAWFAFELEDWLPQAESEEYSVCNFIWVSLPSLSATFLHSFCLSFFLVKVSFVYNKIHMLSCINFDQIFSISLWKFQAYEELQKKKKKLHESYREHPYTQHLDSTTYILLHLLCPTSMLLLFSRSILRTPVSSLSAPKGISVCLP